MPRNVHHACDDFHRASTAIREGTLTRRDVLQRAVFGGLTVYAAQAMPLQRVLEVAEADAQAAPPESPILVSVFLSGGLDLLDTLVPLGSYGRYRDLRSGTASAEGSVTPAGATGLGFHPAMTKGIGGGLAGLFERGQIGFLPGIDYANPNLSHFHSRAFWESGLVTPKTTSGWLGRWLDRHGSPVNPLQGIAAGGSLSPVLRTAGAPVASVSSASDAELWMKDAWDDWRNPALAAWRQLADHGGGEGRAAVGRAARLAHGVAEQLRPLRAKNGVDPLAGATTYPKDNRFGDRLRSLAGLLHQPLGTRIATVSADGQFDTHDAQGPALERELTKVSEALSAFQADLEQRGLADRVLTFVWSEFGRRPEANESGGTDHGAGGIAWVQGRRAASGILTEYPDLTRFDDHGNLAVTVDFRRVYSSLLEGWLGTDAAEVIPNAAGFGRIGLVT